jgi:hypothetical protein
MLVPFSMVPFSMVPFSMVPFSMVPFSMEKLPSDKLSGNIEDAGSFFNGSIFNGSIENGKAAVKAHQEKEKEKGAVSPYNAQRCKGLGFSFEQPLGKKDVKFSMREKDLFAAENNVSLHPLFLYHVGTSLWERWASSCSIENGTAGSIFNGKGKGYIENVNHGANSPQRATPPEVFFSKAHRGGVSPPGREKKNNFAGTSLNKRERVGLSHQTLSLSFSDTVKKEPLLFLSHIESFCEKICGTPFNIHLWRSFWDGGNAIFLAKEIAYFLQRRVPFSKIRREIFREISENRGKVWNSIEGIRISCSGRSGGRSKKAQRGKSETFYWGRNSSSLFLSRVGFGKSTALTQLGAVGVKVWICYKSETYVEN